MTRTTYTRKADPAVIQFVRTDLGDLEGLYRALAWRLQCGAGTDEDRATLTDLQRVIRAKTKRLNTRRRAA